MTVRIGLTGPIGCGKSTITGWLGEAPGVVVIDADAVARDVLAPGSEELAAVTEAFGANLVDHAGHLDRSALGRIVFADPDALRRLEAIVHPAVRRRILASIADAEAAGAMVVAIEAIKLVEGGLAALCDEVWLVTCDKAVQRGRLAARGTGPTDAAMRVAAQGDLVRRVGPVADRTIDTTGDPAATRSQVKLALSAAVRRLQEPGVS